MWYQQAITSNEALELQELPKHAIIVGAGYIGKNASFLVAISRCRQSLGQLYAM
jgi:pyruvate/2-oxoglutarate dehydrogenase complex dihydrolipoamide dehydrogenase (E3) component